MFGPKAHLRSVGNHLFIEGVDCLELTGKFGTPQYVTSETRLKENFRAYRRAFPGADIYFAVKANGNLTLLRILAGEGAGADVFSRGELFVAILAGMPKEKILFNGNSKGEAEHKTALDSGIRISLDSREELISLSELARLSGKKADVLLRINPDISPKPIPKSPPACEPPSSEYLLRRWQRRTSWLLSWASILWDCTVILALRSWRYPPLLRPWPR